jgi:ketosteroid isomerase-like protein
MGQGSDIVRRYFAALSASDVAAVVDLIAPNGDFRTPLESMTAKRRFSPISRRSRAPFPK